MPDIRQETEVADDFNRPDEYPLDGDGRWAEVVASSGGPLAVDNNTAATGGHPNSCSSYWVPDVLDGDEAEAWAVPVGGNSPAIAFGIGLYQNPGSAGANGYEYRSEVTTGGGTWYLYKLTGGTFSEIWNDGGLGPSLTGGAAGKLVLIRRNGNAVELWYDPIADSDWDDLQLIHSQSDTSYTTNLSPILEVFSGLNGWDNFGGPPIEELPQIYRRPNE